MLRKKRKLKIRVSGYFIIPFIIETGEIKTIEVEENKPSFFNLFTNIRLPSSKDETDSLDLETEKEIGHYLDSEFEYGMEFVEEFIPHALDYYLGFKPDNDEYSKYLSEHHRKDTN